MFPATLPRWGASLLREYMKIKIYRAINRSHKKCSLFYYPGECLLIWIWWFYVGVVRSD